MEDLKRTLIDWDGKETESLKAIYTNYSNDPVFVSNLTKWSIQKEELQDASTWLLKHHLDQKNKLNRSQTKALLPALAVAKKWPAQLHLLQILPHLLLVTSDAEMLVEPIEKLTKDKVKFVKAWAYYAFGLMSQLLPELRTEVEQVLQIALEQESAAVKARIRKACKDFKLLQD
ncbi:MAG: hypothetical protein AAF705_14955 [Bacteroidota bacterium]